MMKIKPCPFCGGEAKTGYAIADYNRWGVSCQDCGALVEVQDWKGIDDTEENAIAVWNRRTPEGHVKITPGDVPQEVGREYVQLTTSEWRLSPDGVPL